MRSIVQMDRRFCYICEREGKLTRGIHKHHIFGGANRNLSEQYGLTVHLCLEHHTAGKTAVHNNKNTAEWIHKVGQLAFEENHTHEEFMSIFGKNYL